MFNKESYTVSLNLKKIPNFKNFNQGKHEKYFVPGYTKRIADPLKEEVNHTIYFSKNNLILWKVDTIYFTADTNLKHFYIII